MSGAARLDGRELVARGGQSDIYTYGEGRVLRVARRKQDYERIRYEFQVYTYLRERNPCAPKAFELLDVDGAPSISMERISGPTLMQQIKRNPFRAQDGARTLAGLHLHVLGSNAGYPIVDARERARFCVGSSSLLTDSCKSAVLKVLDHLPDGTRLCHVDFHPGNIIRARQKDYIIDWSAASHRIDLPAAHERGPVD